MAFILGWLLGILSVILSTLGIDQIRKYTQRKEFKKGVFIELKEIRSILAGIVFVLSQRHGACNRDLLNWMRDISAEDPDARPRLETIEEMLKLTDEQIEVMAKHEADKALVRGVTFKKYCLPYLDANMNHLSLFDMRFQRLIHQIRGRLAMLNEDSDIVRYYFERTFDSTMSPENREIIEINLKTNYERIMERSRDIADKITCVIENFSD